MATKDDEKKSSRVRLGQLIPTRYSDGEVKEPDKGRLNVDEAWQKIQDILEMKKIETLGQTIGGMTGTGYSSRAPASGEDGLEKLAKVGSLLGIDFTKISEIRNNEVQSLRKELDDMKKHEIEGRLALLDKTIADTNNTVKQFMENQVQNRNQGGGLFGIADQSTDNMFTKMAMAKMFGFGGEEKKQEDPLETLLKQMEFSERVKNILGLNKPEKPAVDPSLVQLGRLDVLKTVLEDDRAREIAKENAKIQQMKIEKLGGFLTEIKGLIPDVLEAITSRGGGQAANVGIETRQRPPAPRPAPKAPITNRTQLPAMADKVESTVAEQPAAVSTEVPPPDKWVNEEINCPWPDCGKKIPFPVNIPVGYAITCHYCKRPVEKQADLPEDAGKKPEEEKKEEKPS